MIETLKQSLEALEPFSHIAGYEDRITNLRALIAQMEKQEPDYRAIADELEEMAFCVLDSYTTDKACDKLRNRAKELRGQGK